MLKEFFVIMVFYISLFIRCEVFDIHKSIPTQYTKFKGILSTFRVIGAIMNVTNGHRKFKTVRLDMMTGPRLHRPSGLACGAGLSQ